MRLEMALKYSRKFNSVLSEAIEEGLSIICDSATSSILFSLKSGGALKSKIGSLAEFSGGLDDIFGFGSKVIEKQILEVLYIKLRLPPTAISIKFQLAEEVDRAFDLYKKLRGDS